MLECLNCKNKLEEEQLLEIFYSGSKETSEFGLEFERLAVYKDTNKAVRYEDMLLVLEQFSQLGWNKYFENDELLGLTSDIGSITLEPGSQFELSLKPFENINDIKKVLESFSQQMDLAVKDLPIKWLDSGIHPVSTFEDINVIPKQRYKCMSEYLPSKGELPLVMMRETAGVQVCIDYKDEADAMRKMSLALKLSPIVSAIYANSSIRAGKQTGYKSFRAQSWLDTDHDRCGLVSSRLIESSSDFSFKDYAQVLIDIPMIFIDREGATTPTQDLSFRKFMQDGYQGLSANLDDWNTHLSLYFPDVRLKNYIEIRNHDSQKLEFVPSIPALWKGIMLNESSINAIEEILKPLNYFDFRNLRYNTPKYGLDYEIKGYKVSDLAKGILNISYESLKANNLKEEVYLESIIKFVEAN